MEAAPTGWERWLSVKQKWFRRKTNKQNPSRSDPRIKFGFKAPFCPPQTVASHQSLKWASAVLGSPAVLIQPLGFCFCRAGAWEPASCQSLPPGPPSSAAVRGDPEVGVELGTKPDPRESSLEAKRPCLPLSGERKDELIGETAGGRRT